MVTFHGVVRQWDPSKPGGLAVIDIPDELVADFGGRRQTRVAGTMNGTPFTGSTMLVAGGGFCVSASKATLKTASADIGAEVELDIASA